MRVCYEVGFLPQDKRLTEDFYLAEKARKAFGENPCLHNHIIAIEAESSEGVLTLYTTLEVEPESDIPTTCYNDLAQALERLDLGKMTFLFSKIDLC